MKIAVTLTPSKSPMNRWESAYAQRLQLLERANELQWWKYGAITFKLADDTRYTPDFIWLTKTGELVATEVKGFRREDAFIKFKVAAAQFPWLRFEMVTKKAGQWLQIR